jgi:SOS-response transcriptional repressor LexA
MTETRQAVFRYIQDVYKLTGDTPSRKKITTVLNLPEWKVGEAIEGLIKNGYIKPKATRRGYIILRTQ